MRILFLFCLLTSCFFLMQCSPDSNRKGIVTEDGAIKITIESPFGIGNDQPNKVSQYMGDFFFVKLSSLGENFIGRLGKLLICDDIIFK
ncbi:hypothetical protein EDD80_1101 [Anseongella ginsenosidimutans]|uniref:Cyclophilin-like domain-containing protein n=1 Tax=Anseongella ginsenosidimutans TaxID=496056 RepID=A0A4R3KQL9_9SPHI|nr:hypothetical protein EDD80_1101 [Anseongella ginsenosidimutans]